MRALPHVVEERNREDQANSNNLPPSPKQRVRNKFRTRRGTLRQPGVDEYLSLSPEERLVASEHQLGYDDVLEELDESA